MLSTRFTVSRLARPVLSAVVSTLVVTASTALAGFNTFTVGGTTAPSSIQPTVDSFRAALGPNNGNTLGPQGFGRREINWDGGSAVTATTTASPLTTFTNTRGATITSAGATFLQTPLNVAELTGIQPSYQTTFATFSASRIFTLTGSNVTDVTFTVPGLNGAVSTVVRGFGAVFSDVDLASTTKLEFFNASNLSIFVLDVPQGTPGAAPSATLSFAGAIANAGELIARVRITTGNQALGQPDSNGNPVDVVAMDDFIYAEPVPEPATLALSAVVLCVAAARAPRRA